MTPHLTPYAELGASQYQSILDPVRTCKSGRIGEGASQAWCRDTTLGVCPARVAMLGNNASTRALNTGAERRHSAQRVCYNARSMHETHLLQCTVLCTVLGHYLEHCPWTLFLDHYSYKKNKKIKMTHGIWGVTINLIYCL